MSNLSAYLDFELNISDLNGETFTVFVRSDAGEIRETAKFPYAESELETILLKIENAILRSTEAHRAPHTHQNAIVETFGRALFDFVLPGEARSLYNECLREANHRHRGVRIKLSIHSPRLAALPWEFLYDPRKRDYICLNPYTPLVRYTELPQTTSPLIIDTPLRILGLISDPHDMPIQLDVQLERERVSAAIRSLEERGQVELTWVETNNWRDLQRILRSTVDEWHIFHFIGHGGYDHQRNEGYIVLGNDDGTSHHLYASQLARLLARQYQSMRLVLLNACDGARSGLADTLSSTAATLINSGIPAVLAMQYEITNDAAVEFANAFYEAMADNFPVDAAVAEARNAISLSDAGSLEWGVPVLHMRAADGQLFSLHDRDDDSASTGADRPPYHGAVDYLSGVEGSIPHSYNGIPKSPLTLAARQHDQLLTTSDQESSSTADASIVHKATTQRTEPTVALGLAVEQPSGQFVSEDELTVALSQAIAAHNASQSSSIDASADSISRSPLWEIVESIDALDETVVAEASARMQLAANPKPPDPLEEIALDVQNPLRYTDPQMVTPDMWDDDLDGELDPALHESIECGKDDEPPPAAETRAAEDRLYVVKAALEDRNRFFTADVGPKNARDLLHTYVQSQHTTIGIEWVRIPAGEFLMGSHVEQDVHMFEDEAPQFTLYLDEYQISRYPVTNAQYKKFMIATGHDAPPHWSDGEIPAGEEHHPAVNVSWHDTLAFCEWAGVRLPTEAEWEKAARGADGRLYPWGNQPPDPTRCNFDLFVGMTVPVGSYPAGASPYGVCDMAGNVWEWTASVWLDSYENYEEQITKNNESSLRRVLRGGGFRDIEFVRCASRSWDLPNQRYRDLGFRVTAL